MGFAFIFGGNFSYLFRSKNPPGKVHMRLIVEVPNHKLVIFPFLRTFFKKPLKLFLAFGQDILSIVAKVAPWHIFIHFKRICKEWFYI